MEDYEPPRPGIEDELFGSGPDWHNNACLGMPGGFAYIAGYLRAGDVLAQHVETTHHDQDFLVYPMMFVYRHYLELRLKDLRKDCFELLDREVDPKLNHALGVLWKDCRGALDELWDETFGDNDLTLASVSSNSS